MVKIADGVFIRQMTQFDLPVVAENEAWSYEYPWSQQLFADCVSQAGYSCVVLEEHSQVVGHGLVLAGFEEAHLLNLCVHSDSRGKGYAKALLNYFVEACSLASLPVLLLEVRHSNLSAIRLYDRYGFARIGVRKDYYRTATGKENALIMSLDIEG